MHNASCLFVMGSGIQVDRVQPGPAWGVEEGEVTDKPGSIFRPLFHRPLFSPPSKTFVTNIKIYWINIY